LTLGGRRDDRRYIEPQELRAIAEVYGKLPAGKRLRSSNFVSEMIKLGSPLADDHRYRGRWACSGERVLSLAGACSSSSLSPP
jgi:hypothetical protein